MALNRREQRILWFTVIVGAVALLWTQGVGPLLDKYQQLQEDLKSESDSFEKNIAMLNTAPMIEADFKKVEARFPKDDPTRDPAQTFSEEVVTVAETVTTKRPSFDVVVHEPIQDVDEYEFLTFAIGITAELPQIADLLKAYEQKGYLVRNVELEHTKGPDTPVLSLSMTVARIVKFPEEVEEDTSPKTPGLLRL